MREGRPSGPLVRRVITASSGMAKASRQKPAEAGPVCVRRTRIGDSPITAAPNTSTATACQRGAGTAGTTASVKVHLPSNLRRGHTPLAQTLQRLGTVTLGETPAVRPGQ